MQQVNLGVAVARRRVQLHRDAAKAFLFARRGIVQFGGLFVDTSRLCQTDVSAFSLGANGHPAVLSGDEVGMTLRQTKEKGQRAEACGRRSAGHEP